MNMTDTTTIAADQALAREHVELLTGSAATPVCFRAILDTGGGATKIHGTVADCWPEIMAHQAAGCGIFLVVNDGGNSAAEITRVRALFVDGDNIPTPATWHVEPDWLTRRDETHWLAYWRVDDLDVGAFNEAQRQLIAHYGTDQSVHDLPRVMRLAGTLHLKDRANPKLITLEPSWLSGVRPAAEILAGLPPVPRKAAYERQRAAPDVELDTNCRRVLVHMIARLAEPATNLGAGGLGYSDEATRDLANVLLDISSPETVIDAMVEEWMPRCSGEWDAGFIIAKVERLAASVGTATRKNDVGCMDDGLVNDLILQLIDDPDYVPSQEPIVYPDPRTREELLEALRQLQPDPITEGEKERRRKRFETRRPSEDATLPALTYYDTEMTMPNIPDGAVMVVTAPKSNHKTGLS
jgi:hypothetical protein